MRIDSLGPAKSAARDPAASDPAGSPSAAAAAPATSGLRLCDLPRHTPAEVLHVSLPQQPEDRELVLRLAEIGFVPGEPVRVIAHGLPGGDPLAVRLGDTTFALRRFEAGFVHVRPLAATTGAAR